MEQSPNDPTKAWFESIPDVSGSSPLPEEPKRSSSSIKKRLLILLVVVVALGGGTAYLLFNKSPTTAKACLSPSDYDALTDTRNQDEQYSPEGTFYTASISFDKGTATYSNDTEAADKAALKKITDFYATHHASTSIILTIRADYFENDSSEAASKRTSSLRDLLVKNGVDQASIRTEEPTNIDSGSELEPDSEELARATAYVSVASDDTCQETK